MQEIIEKIIAKTEPEFLELRNKAIDEIYDYLITQKPQSKEYIDNASSREDGIRNILGDYFYIMLEDRILVNFDDFLSNVKEIERVGIWETGVKEPKLILPNKPYKRISLLDDYKIREKYEDYDYDIIDVYDYVDEHHFKENEGNIEIISEIIKGLDCCEYLGAALKNNRLYAELYKYNDDALYSFNVVLGSKGLEIVSLEIASKPEKKDNELA